MKLKIDDLELINKATSIEKKSTKVDFPIVNTILQLEQMSKYELLFICDSLANLLTPKDNYYADDLISEILIFLEKRGDF